MAGWRELLTSVTEEKHASLVGYGVLLTGDRSKAEDLVQDALVKVFARPRKLPSVAAADQYVRRTMATLYVDHSRRNSLWRRLRPSLIDTENARSPESAVAAGTDVRAALALLSPRERACVVLRHFDDMTITDIAHRLGISEGAIKRYLADGMSKLGAELADSEERILITATQRSRRN